MNAILSRLSALVARRPGRMLIALGLITVALAIASGNQEADTELSAFATDSEAAIADERVQEEFGAGGEVFQVIVDAGPDGDVLAADGLAAAAQVEDTLRGAGVEFADGPGAIRSFAAPAGDGPNQLLSSDAADGAARAGLVIAAFPASATETEIYDGSLELAAAIDELDPAGDVELSPFNGAVLNDELEAQSEEEMPRLLSISMLLILGILMFQYRSVSDVLIGLVGLIATIIWMFGIGVLLGPAYLGLVGPFTQISLIIPVLLIGLGVDYAIHLTSRYREEQRHGQSPDRAASMAVRTVGGALVLATVTTVLGFLTNLTSPLPPIADFGIFTAVGVISAFIIMTILVPAARNLLDARRIRRSPDHAAKVRTSTKSGALGKVIGKASIVAERAPKAALGVALAISIAATAASTQVGTTFSQDDFIPADSEIGRLLDRIDTLFGGGITETTFVLVEGDLADPAVANALAELPAAVSTTEGVRQADGVAQVDSVVGLVARLGAADPAFAGEAEALGYSPAEGFAPDADVAAVYDLARQAQPPAVATMLSEDGTAALVSIGTVAGQDGARDLAAALEGDLAGLQGTGVDTTITSEGLVLEDALDALTSSQTQGIVVTLVAALILLVAYYGFTERKPTLGLITMIPSIAVVSWVLGTMWLLGISFNVLTAMVASLGIGIGVPFGIHVTHRFLEDRRRYDTIDEAVRHTVTHTGGAMAASAATTAMGFGVLILASLTPMRQFGTIVAITIVYSFLAAILIQPACLKLWGEWRARRGEVAALHDHEHRDLAGHGDDDRDLVSTSS